jgi:hypothetical protein
MNTEGTRILFMKVAKITLREDNSVLDDKEMEAQMRSPNREENLEMIVVSFLS